MQSTHHGPRGQGGPPAERNVMPQPARVRYYAADGALDPELLDAEAEKRAKQLSKVTATQMRRFYEHVLALQRRLQVESEQGTPEQREKTFQQMRADFKMLKAKAAYAHGRDPRQFPKEFLQFIVDHTGAVEKAVDFEAFCKHFQAVVAFHKFYGESK